MPTPSISEQIVIGVVSGVLTSALLYLIAVVVTRVLVPWYKRITYEGVDVNGTWEYRFDQPGDYGSMLLHLSQSAHDLKGEAAVTVRNGENESNFIYMVRGTIWEGYASLTLKSRDRRVIAFGVLLLKVGASGASLEGFYVFKDSAVDLPHSVQFFLRRKNG